MDSKIENQKVKPQELCIQILQKKLTPKHRRILHWLGACMGFPPLFLTRYNSCKFYRSTQKFACRCRFLVDIFCKVSNLRLRALCPFSDCIPVSMNNKFTYKSYINVYKGNFYAHVRLRCLFWFVFNKYEPVEGPLNSPCCICHIVDTSLPVGDRRCWIQPHRLQCFRAVFSALEHH